MVETIKLPTTDNECIQTEKVDNNNEENECRKSKDVDIEKVDSNNEENERRKSKDEDTEKTEVDDEETSPIPMVAAAVSTYDDPKLSCLTFRFWVLSTFFTALGAALSEFYYFRPTNSVFSLFFVLFMSYVLGRWMARILPNKNYSIGGWQFNLNPGPFNVKEHVCIYVATNAGGITAYAMDIIAIQELFYNQHVGFFVGMLLLISTQMLGYGLAGFLRKYLVRPANMIWPSNLVFTSMFNTLHGNFVPQYMFTWLTSMALLCLAAPANATLKNLGSGYHGVGILNFSLDWNTVGQWGPLFTPWFASVNFYVGVVLSAWIITPLLYYYNVLEAKNFPFNSPHSFDKNGDRYNQTAIIDQQTGSLNITAYEEVGPIYLSASFANTYFWSFVGFTATVSHVALFYGEEIWTQFKASRSEEKEDIHTKMMKVYPEIPNLWYGIIFVSMLIISIILGYVNGAHLPWWASLMSVGLACIMVLPIGVIQAISNNQIGLNVISEMICGYMLPGRPIANVYFKTYGYMAMYQCLSLVSDLKLGHYMKIPPKSMFVSQLWGTGVGCLVNYWVMRMIIAAKRPYLDGTLDDPTGQWAGYNSQVFNTASIVWGLIGPAHTFGTESIYHPLLWGFLIGIFAPIPFYLLHRKYPKAQFNLINIPVISVGMTILPTYYTNFIVMGFIASFLSQYYGIRYRYKWFKKYNYILSAALDSASQIVTMIIFFCLNGIVQAPFPEWWGNNGESEGERCFGSE
ncbi:2461_t:CDS:10 [Ambispora leptoticha]|uniref:2461_t:CDS:1 n=1 Tax=Ambispora leptoticha TaxID=144679 RepID=A0A9N8ZEI7_9GLOM|nr:2461_t:CDS:10 [Ambispora leptoticha]